MSTLDLQLRHEAQEVLHREAMYLDAQRWDDWLALFTEDASFWLPAWTDEHRLSASPEQELSLMYCAARAGLEDRVWRVRSGLSVASKPLPRTTHMVSNSVVTPTEDAAIVQIASSWSCHVFRLKDRQQHTFFGRYEHKLRHTNGQWHIASKTVVLMNDTVPTLLDFYCV